MTQRKRITYLDIARGIGMLLVVMGHVEYIDLNVRFYVTAFHMPLFFVISGILIQEKETEKTSFSKLIKTKLYSIMLPYVVFSLLSFLIEGSRIAIKGLDEWDIVFRQLFQSVCLQGVSTLWFLPALFISELAFVGIRKRTSHGATIGIVGILIFLCVFLSYEENLCYQMYGANLIYGLLHEVLSMILRNLFCVAFICLGYYLNKCVLKKPLKGVLEITLAVCGLLLAGVLVKINPGVDLRYMRLHNFMIYTGEVVSGTVSVLFLSIFLRRLPLGIVSKVIQFYGRNSLVIMVTHMDFRVLYCSIKVAEIIYTWIPGQVIFCIGIVLFVFLFEIPIIWFINKFFPVIIGKRIKSS